GVRSLEQCSPFVSASRGEPFSNDAPDLRPIGWIIRIRWSGLIQTDQPAELREKLAFDWRHRQVLAIGTEVDIVKRRTGIEAVLSTLLTDPARREHPKKCSCQRRSSVDHGCVDDLSKA